SAWRSAGHEVVTPDLYDGITFDDVSSGVAHAQSLEPGSLDAAAADAAGVLAPGFVVCGISLGAIPAMRLAVDDDGVAAVVLAGSCLGPEFLDAPWPASVPLRIFASRGDVSFRDEGDLDAARIHVASDADAKLKLLPGEEHLFMEADDPASVAATSHLFEAVLRLLDRIDEDLPAGADEEEDRAEGVVWDLP
ncbi:MAG: dienelactone hydrolase family protein, partial [Galactobacter sp.]